MNKNKLDELLHLEEIPAYSELKIGEVIRAGHRYMNHHIPYKTSIIRLFLNQLNYLSPMLWLVQLLAIVIVVGFCGMENKGLSEVQNILIQTAPLLAIFAVPELMKDSIYNMSEIEGSCKNKGSRTLILRLIAVGGINIIVLNILSAILAISYGYSFLSLILYSILPYNIANIITLLCINSFGLKSKQSALYISVSCFIVIMALPMWINISEIITNTILIATLIGTTLILSIQLFQLFKQTSKGELIAWN